MRFSENRIPGLNKDGSKDMRFSKNRNSKKEKKEEPRDVCASLMLAEKFENANQDPTGWLMSEKLDGVRAYWNGKTLFSRNGHKFNPPQWWIDALPKDMALDGELFTKRDDF